MLTVVGDPHSKPNNQDLMRDLFEMVEALGNDVIWLGDLLDTKEVVRSKCFNEYYHYFKRSKLKHYVLVGNHDWHNLECESHSLEPLKELANVEVIDEPRGLHELGIIMLPYIHDQAELRSALEAARLSDAHILVGHLEVAGFDYGNGHICEQGLTLGDFKELELVISGHFHKFQQTENLWYIGTPFSHSFGESNQQKFIGVLNPVECTLELIETPFPKHITIESHGDADSLAKAMELACRPCDHVRVVLSGSEETLLKFDKERFPGVKFIEKPEDLQADAVKIEETASNEEKFKLWAEGKGLKADTVKLGMDILKAVGQ